MTCLDYEHQRSINSNIVWLDLSKFKRLDVFNSYKPIIVCGEDGIECKTHNYSSCSSFIEKKFEYVEERYDEDDNEEEDEKIGDKDVENWTIKEVEGLNF